MLNNKKVIILLVGIIVVLLLLIMQAQSEFDFNAFIKAKDKIENDEKYDNVIMEVNGEPITSKAYEEYQLMLDISKIKQTDKMIKDNLIRQALIRSEIKKHNITCTVEEVEEFNNQRFSALEQNESIKKMIDEYLKLNNMTLEEYKIQSKEVSKLALATLKLKALVFENRPDSKSELNQELYFNSYIEQLKENAIIVDFKSKE